MHPIQRHRLAPTLVGLASSWQDAPIVEEAPSPLPDSMEGDIARRNIVRELLEGTWQDDPIFEELRLFLRALIDRRREIFREISKTQDWKKLEEMFDMWSLAKGE